jgi:superoxide dismutase, Cu-Zn family
MHASGSPLRNVVRVAQATAVALVLAACAADDPGGKKSSSAIGARLQPIAGGVGHGLVTFRPYDGGLVVTADVGGFAAGPYRFVIHTTPVCTSPNGFSAGPPFLLPGTGAPVAVPAVIFHQGTATFATRVPGIALGGPTGVEGKSLVLHASESGPLDAQPGVPNDRVACGVIGAVPTLF